MVLRVASSSFTTSWLDQSMLGMRSPYPFPTGATSTHGLEFLNTVTGLPVWLTVFAIFEKFARVSATVAVISFMCVPKYAPHAVFAGGMSHRVIIICELSNVLESVLY